MRFSTSLNSAPARCCVWPVLAPAQAQVGVGIGLRETGGVILLARRVLRSHFAYHTFLLECFMFVPRLLFVARAKQRRLAASCVSVPRRSRSPVERSQMLYGYRTCLVHFRLVRFFPAIPTGERSRRRGKVLFCENILSLRYFPRGERWGCAPQTAPKSHWLSGLSSFDSRQSTFLQNPAITAIPESPHSHCATPGYTERPARLQFMVGQVGLYEYPINTLNRPDSSRPQAARSRVACAKQCGKPHGG